MSVIEDELNKLFGPEGQQLEYKRILPPPKALTRDIASFANAEGGKIVIGVGVGPDGTLAVEGFSEDIPYHDVINAALFLLRPYPHISYHFQYIEGKPVLVIHIEKTSVPILSQDGYFYVRKGSQNIHGTEDDLRKAIDEV